MFYVAVIMKVTDELSSVIITMPQLVGSELYVLLCNRV